MNQAAEVVKSEPGKASAPIRVTVKIETSAPLMHPKTFSEILGLSTGVIGGWIDSGYLPTVKVGRYQMINLVLLTKNLKKGHVL